MSKTYRVAIIGCGRMGTFHAKGYSAEPRCRVVALADVDRAKAETFAKDHGYKAKIYTDHKEMLAAEKPDLVSVCLWTKLHLPVVRDCVEAGIKAIHCEKPMAPTWGEAQEIAAIARQAGTRLTFNHQRRFSPAYAKARELLAGREFGELERIEACNPDNILDWGTHIFDLIHMYNRETPAEWVMGQVDARRIKKWFDIPFEHAAVASVKFANGVRAVVHSGDDKEVNLGIRLTAGHGVIEVQGEHKVRWLHYGEGAWKSLEFEPLPGDQAPASIAAVVKNLIDTLESGEEAELSAERALRSTEVIFAVYESCRRRARVDLPLEQGDNALVAMLEGGEISPR